MESFPVRFACHYYSESGFLKKKKKKKTPPRGFFFFVFFFFFFLWREMVSAMGSFPSYVRARKISNCPSFSSSPCEANRQVGVFRPGAPRPMVQVNGPTRGARPEWRAVWWGLEGAGSGFWMCGVVVSNRRRKGIKPRHALQAFQLVWIPAEPLVVW